MLPARVHWARCKCAADMTGNGSGKCQVGVKTAVAIDHDRRFAGVDRQIRIGRTDGNRITIKQRSAAQGYIGRGVQGIGSAAGDGHNQTDYATINRQRARADGVHIGGGSAIDRERAATRLGDAARGCEGIRA